jgi:prepilin-type N-terminal cleavage/methylation domain-containing protein
MRRAFTLVEALLALAILSIGLIGLISAVMYASQFNTLNLLEAEAVKVLSEELDRLKYYNYSDIPTNLNNGATSCEEIVSNPGTYPNNIENRLIRAQTYTFGKFYELLDEDTNIGVKAVRVHVCWQYLGRVREISGDTVVRQ